MDFLDALGNACGTVRENIQCHLFSPNEIPQAFFRFEREGPIPFGRELFDDQEIDITLRSRTSASIAAKQNDTVRLQRFEPLHDLRFQFFDIDHESSFLLFPPRSANPCFILA